MGAGGGDIIVDVVHGDLTPTAILVDRQAAVRVNNFGLPPNLDYFLAEGGDELQPLLTDGTPYSDVLALGLLLRQLLSNAELAGAEHGARQVRADVAPELSHLVTRCTTPNANNAITDAATLASVLEEISEQLAETRRPLSTDTPAALRVAHAIAAEQARWSSEQTVAGVLAPQPIERGSHEVGSRFSVTSYIGIGKETYREYEGLLSPLGFEWNKDARLYLIAWTEELEKLLTQETSAAFDVFTRKPYRLEQCDRFDSIQYWYWEHWKFFRSEVKTSIIQGIVVFLSLFETDPDVRRVFCPPKDLYDGKPCSTDPRGRILPHFDELIESGKVVGLNFPVALNPALAKTIGTMMKIDYQRAVQLRIPRMDAHPERHFRPTVFICDEYQNFATVGGDNPTGDERFLSISRQPKCIPIVATQSVSSLKDALPNEGVKTLLQALRNKVFLTTTDPETARYASELCGKADRTRISYTVSESSSNANVSWLSGRTSSSKGSVSASKQYQKHKEPLFEEKVFFDLKNAQSVVVAFDGVSPLPPTYCYLKPDFLPTTMSWFEQEGIAFDPERTQQ